MNTLEFRVEVLYGVGLRILLISIKVLYFTLSYSKYFKYLTYFTLK